MIRKLGHLALWPVFYTVGVLVLMLDLLGDDSADWRRYLFVGFCAHSCYLLDRIKVSDARLDPSDAAAQPDRYRFITKHTSTLRTLVVLDVLIATLIASQIWMPLLPVPLIGVICVHLYAGRPAAPDNPRIKDFPALKGIVIAGAHTALAYATAVGGTGSIDTLAETTAVLSLLIVATMILADAVLCDLDDLRADRAYATKSVPVLIGRSSAWRLALIAHLGAGIGLIVLESRSAGAIVFVTGIIVSDVLFVFVERQRDWVDARLLLLALLLVATN